MRAARFCILSQRADYVRRRDMTGSLLDNLEALTDGCNKYMYDLVAFDC